MKGRPNHIRCIEYVGVFFKMSLYKTITVPFTQLERNTENTYYIYTDNVLSSYKFCMLYLRQYTHDFFFIVNTSDVSKSECKMHDCFSFYSMYFVHNTVAIYKSKMS